MSLRQRDIDVARFADGFAVVQRLQHRKKAGVFLQLTRQSIKHPCAAMSAQGRPLGLCFARCLHGGVYIGLCRAAQPSKRVASCGIGRGEFLCSRCELAADEMPKRTAFLSDPGQGCRICFRGFAIFHGIKNLFDGGRGRV